MTHAIDITDLGVGLIGSTSARSVGVAALRGSELTFGDQALALCRVQPNHSESRFWRDLASQSPMNRFPGIRHSADLAWHHLQALDLKNSAATVSAVYFPPHYTGEQLALLSGMLQSLKVQQSLLLNRSLLFAALHADSWTHLDFQLHQTVVSRFEQSGNQRVVSATEIYPGLGLLELTNEVMRFLQRLFIEKTRFDPLHHAQTEQLLFNQVLELLGNPESHHQRQEIFIEFAGGRYRIEFPPSQIQQATAEFAKRMSAVIPVNRWSGDSFTRLLPLHLRDQLQVAGDDELKFAMDQLLLDQVVDGKFVELTSIHSLGVAQKAAPLEPKPRSPEPVPTTPVPATKTVPMVSHLLHDGEAWHGQGLYLVANDAGLEITYQAEGKILASFEFRAQGLTLVPREMLRINGKPVHDEQVLKPEDVISLSGIAGSLVAIAVRTDAA